MKVSGGESSISFVNMAIPIEYRIRPDGVMNYAYGNVSPVKVLSKVGEQAVVEYLSGASMGKLMSSGRGEAEAVLREKIQHLADRNDLGIEIVRVGIMDAHPPVEKVAPAYQDVIGSLEEKETEVLKARADEEKIIPAAEAKALEMVTAAKNYALNKSTIAQAECAAFPSQVKFFRAMPAMFKLNVYMSVLEENLPGIEKYVVSKGLTVDEVYELNFETRDRLDLIDIDPSELSNETKK